MSNLKRNRQFYPGWKKGARVLDEVSWVVAVRSVKKSRERNPCGFFDRRTNEMGMNEAMLVRLRLQTAPYNARHDKAHGKPGVYKRIMPITRSHRSPADTSTRSVDKYHICIRRCPCMILHSMHGQNTDILFAAAMAHQIK